MKSFVHVLDVAEACFHVATANGATNIIINLTGGVWAWPQTVAVMEELLGEKILVTRENRKHGWVGDPMAILRTGRMETILNASPRSITEGVRDALIGLGWPK